MIRRHVSFWTPVLLFSGAAFLLLLMLARLAHADPAAAAPSVGLASDAVVWLLGILVALRILEMGLTWLAPRTKTTWDDQLLADVRELRQTGQEILQQVKTPAPGIPPAAALVVLLVGGLALQPGCANPKVRAAEHAAIVCGRESAPSVAAELARWGAALALAGGKIDWAGIEADALGAGSVIGGCAVHEFTAALKKAPVPQLATLTASAAESPAATAEALLAKLSATWGGATWTVEP